MNEKKEEIRRVSQWISKLNVNNHGWVNGDLESRTERTADMVNHSIKYAVELKREKGESVDNKDGNLVTISNRIESYFTDTNKKFINYPKYKTILIIELKSTDSGAFSAMGGIGQLHFAEGQLVASSIKNKKLFSKTENIGCIIFWPAQGGSMLNGKRYFDNPFSKPEHKVTKSEAENIIGNSLEFIEL